MNHRTQLLDEAAEWHLRLQGEAVNDDTISRWVQWCESHPDKQRAFDEIREFWQLTDGLEPMVRAGEFIDVPGAPAAPRAFVFRRSPALLVGAAAAASALVWLAWSVWTQPFSSASGILTSQDTLSETRLPDGSGVQLAARSSVAVNYTERDRNLELKNGEAFFTVAPNRQRPFVVTVGNLRVRALGTAFNLRRAGSRTVVTVTEGLVEVARTGHSDARTRASAGQQLIFVDHEIDPVVSTASADAALAWRDGRLEYVAEPLEAVIADLNRYTQRPAVVADDAAKALRFSGTVLTGSTAEWIAALPGILPLTVQNENGVDVIRSTRE